MNNIGMMESWGTGIMGKNVVVVTTFHHSIVRE
jgi:hypothetical protein